LISAFSIAPDILPANRINGNIFSVSVCFFLDCRKGLWYKYHRQLNSECKFTEFLAFQSKPANVLGRRIKVGARLPCRGKTGIACVFPSGLAGL